MSLRVLPTQVRVVCDGCGATLGERERGYTMTFDADDHGRLDDYLGDHDWTASVGPRHLCSRCTGETSA